jgi:predicted Zn-dependent protease
MMSSFIDFFALARPRNYHAELKVLNDKMEAQPGNAADHDKRSEILLRLGNAAAAINDFETATNLEPDSRVKELRSRELEEMKKRFT